MPVTVFKGMASARLLFLKSAKLTFNTMLRSSMPAFKKFGFSMLIIGTYRKDAVSSIF